MQGALLRSGKSDSFIAMGETGQPVSKAALQIIAALTRKNPDLAKFLAVPKSNEQGSVIDWYSPVTGDVIPWTSATEEERDHARAQLNQFKVQVSEMSQGLVQSGDRSQQSDLVIFGKLLGLVPNCPEDSYVYLVNSQRTNAAGQSEDYQQPVLSFWGFIACEDDRKREPLYFLTPRAPKVPESAPLLAPSAPLAEPVAAPVVEQRKSWWRRFWWLWPLLLLLLLLLLLSLLRGCVPNMALPGLPSLPNAKLPEISMPQLNGQVPEAGLPSGLGLPAGAGAGAGSALTGGATPEQPAEQAAPEAPTPEPLAEQPTPPEPAPAEPEAEAERPAPEPAPTPPLLPEPSPTASPATPQPLSLPPDAADGSADFLNGHYRAGAGIQDTRTGKPLRLEYQFEDGKGSVTVQRPDGVACTGGVAAAMNAGVLGINSQGQAQCTDGSLYDMPQINCQAGAQSIADCSGNYGNQSFPMTMRHVGE